MIMQLMTPMMTMKKRLLRRRNSNQFQKGRENLRAARPEKKVCSTQEDFVLIRAGYTYIYIYMSTDEDSNRNVY